MAVASAGPYANNLHLTPDRQMPTSTPQHSIFRGRMLFLTANQQCHQYHWPLGRQHTHPFNGPFSRTTQVSRYRKVKPIWILLKQETVSGSGISWAICKSAPRSHLTVKEDKQRNAMQIKCRTLQYRRKPTEGLGVEALSAVVWQQGEDAQHHIPVEAAAALHERAQQSAVTRNVAARVVVQLRSTNYHVRVGCQPQTKRTG